MIKDQLAADSMMLSKLNIMDYSLLVGIERRPAGHQTTPSHGSYGGGLSVKSGGGFHRMTTSNFNNIDQSSHKRHRFNSPDNLETYHISMIDYLQQWNFTKKGERFMKTKFLGKKGPELSASEPVFYQTRFEKVINGRIITICKSEKHLSYGNSFVFVDKLQER